MSLFTLRSCSETRTLIAKATEGTLEQSGRDRLMAHLVGCSRCREQVLAEAAAEAALTQVAGQPLGTRTTQCPPDEVIEAFATGTLSPGDRSHWSKHVAQCLYCQSEIGELRHFLADTAEALPELAIAVPGHGASQLPSIAAQARSLSPAERRYSSSAWVSAVGLALILAMAVPALISLPQGHRPGRSGGAPGTQMAAKPPAHAVTPQPPGAGSAPEKVPFVAPGGQSAVEGPASGAPESPIPISLRRHPMHPRHTTPARDRTQQMPEPDYEPEQSMLARAGGLTSGDGAVGGPHLPATGDADARRTMQGSNPLDETALALGSTDATPALVREALATETPAGTPTNPLPTGEEWSLRDVELGASLGLNHLPMEAPVPDASAPDLGAAAGETPAGRAGH